MPVKYNNTINNIMFGEVPFEPFWGGDEDYFIWDDIDKLAAPLDFLKNDEIQTLLPMEEPSSQINHEIRNHDCMWSGRCISHPDKLKNTNNNSNNIVNNHFTTSNNYFNNNNNNINLKTSNGHQQQTQQQQPRKQIQSINNYITQQPQQQQQQHITTPAAAAVATNQIKTQQQQQKIPAGRSLLLNSRLNQINKISSSSQQQMTPITTSAASVTTSPPPPPLPSSLTTTTTPANTKLSILSTTTTNDYLKDREIIARPDTPLSLDDEPPEFKHSIDLATCTMGSNKMSLLPSPGVGAHHNIAHAASIIKMIKEELDTNVPQVRIDISSMIAPTKPENIIEVYEDMKASFSDFEDEIDEEDSAIEMDTDSDISSRNAGTSPLSSTYEYQGTHVGDHSYTRCKKRVDVVGLGVQTPSDSEEEIDVVSVGDKTLPTNPSARDRRALQTTVAHKISARIVKPTTGVRTTIPLRRRKSDDLNTTTNSSLSSLTGCSTPNSKLSSLSSASSVSSMSNIGPSINCMNGGTTTVNSPNPMAPRKRNRSREPDAKGSSSKKHRGKKQRSSPSKKQSSDSDEADTIEKRNLHNDMERQRRIGLKNLFEELKRQIPNIKDKDRAPKVTILREAAALCIELNDQNHTFNLLKKKQSKLLSRVRNLRTALAVQRPSPHEIIVE